MDTINIHETNQTLGDLIELAHRKHGGNCDYDDIVVETTRGCGFKEWWYQHGSGITPLKAHDMEEHAERVAEASWYARSLLS